VNREEGSLRRRRKRHRRDEFGDYQRERWGIKLSHIYKDVQLEKTLIRLGRKSEKKEEAATFGPGP